MIIGLVGKKTCGKDLCASILQRITPFTRVAFADRMKKAYYDLNPLITCNWHLQEIVDDLGWDWAKEEYPEIRRGLQRFGTEMGRSNFGESFWVDLAWQDVSHWEGHADHKNYVITDVRFENEIAKVRAWKGQIWRIERDDQAPDDPNDPILQHPSEWAWRNTVPDYVIHNPGPSHPDGLTIYQDNVAFVWDACHTASSQK